LGHPVYCVGWGIKLYSLTPFDVMCFCSFNHIVVGAIRLHVWCYNFVTSFDILLIKINITVLFVLFVVSFEAIDIRPSDRKCLIARAQCYQHLGEADKALADANETLREDNKYIKVGQTQSFTLI